MPTQLKEKSRAKGSVKKIDPRIKARIEKVRREKIEKRKKRLIIAAAIISPVAIAVAILSSPLTAVNHVKVFGPLNSNQVKTVLNTADLKYHPQMALVFSGDLAQKIKEIPWAGNVKVVKKWPDAINIIVQERLPVAYIEANNQYFETDVTGRLIYALKTRPNLPQLLASGVPDNLGSYISRKYSGALYTASRLGNLGSETQSIGITTGIVLHLQGSLTVKLGDTSNLGEKMADLSAILKYRKPTGPSTIDVAVPQYPVVSSS